jgi:hypothetical protein
MASSLQVRASSIDYIVFSSTLVVMLLFKSVRQGVCPGSNGQQAAGEREHHNRHCVQQNHYHHSYMDTAQELMASSLQVRARIKSCIACSIMLLSLLCTLHLNNKQPSMTCTICSCASLADADASGALGACSCASAALPCPVCMNPACRVLIRPCWRPATYLAAQQQDCCLIWNTTHTCAACPCPVLACFACRVLIRPCRRPVTSQAAQQHACCLTWNNTHSFAACPCPALLCFAHAEC